MDHNGQVLAHQQAFVDRVLHCSLNYPHVLYCTPIIQLRDYLASRPRPMNNVKIYGSLEDDRWGGEDQGVQKFWRNIFAGAASARFHRPPSGSGLNAVAQANIRSMRLLLEQFDIFRAEPDSSSRLLSARKPNQAYLAAVGQDQFAVYFPDGGSVILDLAGAPGSYRLDWLRIPASRWQEGTPALGGGPVTLTAPGDGHWVALLVRNEVR